MIERQISEGGYGVIYKGWWRKTVVAIKKFKLESISEGTVKDFLSECHAMEAIRHPNVVQFLGVGC
jgi:serine/threonine protein kinase